MNKSYILKEYTWFGKKLKYLKKKELFNVIEYLIDENKNNEETIRCSFIN